MTVLVVFGHFNDKLLHIVPLSIKKKSLSTVFFTFCSKAKHGKTHHLEFIEQIKKNMFYTNTYCTVTVNCEYKYGLFSLIFFSDV